MVTIGFAAGESDVDDGAADDTAADDTAGGDPTGDGDDGLMEGLMTDEGNAERCGDWQPVSAAAAARPTRSAKLPRCRMARLLSRRRRVRTATR